MVLTPTAYFHGTESGWYEGTQSRHVRHHPDPAAAAADFIHRLAAWLDGRHILGEDPEPRTD